MFWRFLDTLRFKRQAIDIGLAPRFSTPTDVARIARAWP